MQSLGQDRVLDRAEQRRMGAHGKQCQQHQRQVVAQKADGADGHDADFGQLDQADQRILGVLLTELSGQCGKQEERQNEQQGAEVDPDRAVTVDGQLVENRQDQRLLEQVVVERSQRLGNEERQEPSFAEKAELRGLTHRPCT
ncbi:hypothetical protein D3C77_380300 [compost metagenome]